MKSHLVDEKRALGWLGYIGDEILPSYIGIMRHHEIRIPINQPGFKQESKGPGFFSWLKWSEKLEVGHRGVSLN